TTGQVRSIRVVKPLGFGLDEKAIEAAQKWTFKPALKDGCAIDMMAQIEVSFHLSPQSESNPDSEPVVVKTIKPKYSPEARKAGVTGTVNVSVVVDRQGRPQDIRVVKPLGFGLDEKAIEAVQKWKFKPAMTNGLPVDRQVQVQINFRLF